MKNFLIYTILSLFTTTIIHAQTDRSTAPEPGPAPDIKIGEYESFTLENGLQVFVVEDHKIPRVSYSFHLDNPLILEKEKAGYIGITGSLLGTATKNKTKAEIDEAIDFIGATVSTSANGFYASSLKSHNDKLLSIVSEVILEAEFIQPELDKIKRQYLSNLAMAKNDPSALANRIQRRVIYGQDHPYGELISEQSIGAVTIEDCMNYYNTYYRPNGSYMAIVGDITMEEAKANIEKYFGAWEKREINRTQYPFPQKPQGVQVVIVDRPEAVQSHVQITYPVDYNPTQTDYLPAKTMNTLLGGGWFRLFDNLRETHGYTYGSYSRLSSDEYVGSFEAFANMRTSATDSAIHEMLYEMERIRTEPASDDEINRVKKYLTGQFALSLESPRTVANFAINKKKYNLPPTFYTHYLKSLNNVTKNDILEAAQHYITPDNTYIIVVGNAANIEKQLKPFDTDGIIDFYNPDGEPVSNVENK